MCLTIEQTILRPTTTHPYAPNSTSPTLSHRPPDPPQDSKTWIDAHPAEPCNAAQATPISENTTNVSYPTRTKIVRQDCKHEAIYYTNARAITDTAIFWAQEKPEESRSSLGRTTRLTVWKARG